MVVLWVVVSLVYCDNRLKYNKTNITKGIDIIERLNPQFYEKVRDLDSTLNMIKKVCFIVQ